MEALGRPRYSCYILQSQSNLRKTYCGCTNNLGRRLRQHNGLLRGGAYSTRSGRPWDFACVVGPFSCKNMALRFEWFLKVKHSPVYDLCRKNKMGLIQSRVSLLYYALQKMPDFEVSQLCLWFNKELFKNFFIDNRTVYESYIDETNKK